MNLSRLEKALGFANGSIVKSDEKIQAVRLKAIADYFSVSMEYLLTGETPQDVISPSERRLLELYRHADSGTQSGIMMILESQCDLKKEAISAS